MEYSFFEDAINQAKSIEDIFKENMTVDEAKKFISKYIATNQEKYNPKKHSSEQEFIRDRLKLAYAVKMVVADKLGTPNEKIGLSIEKNTKEVPNDMKPEIYKWLTSENHGGSWWDFKWQSEIGDINVKDTNLLGVVSLSKNYMLKSDTYDFLRLISHELGHTRQTVLGTLNNEADEKISKTTERYIYDNPSKTNRDIVWSKKYIEKDADRFADSMCIGFLHDACQEHGFNGQLISMGLKAFKTAANSVIRHFRGTILYPIIEANAIRYNKKIQAQEAQAIGQLEKN